MPHHEAFFMLSGSSRLHTDSYYKNPAQRAPWGQRRSLAVL